MDDPAFNGFPPIDNHEIVDKAEPYVQAEWEKMNGWYKWKLKARVKGDDVQELLRILSQADDLFKERFGAQDKKEV